MLQLSGPRRWRFHLSGGPFGWVWKLHGRHRLRSSQGSGRQWRHLRRRTSTPRRGRPLASGAASPFAEEGVWAVGRGRHPHTLQRRGIPHAGTKDVAEGGGILSRSTRGRRGCPSHSARRTFGVPAGDLRSGMVVRVASSPAVMASGMIAGTPQEGRIAPRAHPLSLFLLVPSLSPPELVPRPYRREESVAAGGWAGGWRTRWGDEICRARQERLPSFTRQHDGCCVRLQQTSTHIQTCTLALGHAGKLLHASNPTS